MIYKFLKGSKHMKKTLPIYLAFGLILALSATAFAQGGSGSGSGTKTGTGTGSGTESGPGTGNGQGITVGQPQGQNSAPGQGVQVQDQNKVNTQNQGEDSQLKVSTQNNENTSSRQHMSNVAQAVEDFLSNGNKSGEMGGQISEIAKQQQATQSQIGKSLDKIEGKSQVMKSLFGPDYKAIKDMKQLIQQNQVRIQQLQNLQTETQNQGENTQLQVMIKAMVDQNTALQNQMQTEENVKSLFGWLIKLFY
ncbi:hypothetical protein C4561_05135 [candidate division WWE3 bacterium]|jgi:hypothetical protein|uniref:Uncharacterized protein n=1 Tax=candidate division WWE3 bacterium TaxID=2053526 RepID=A0A3A4ZB06_UNCKA|nr:MAG: hypothetical protein C4561_05135 [candidate division WWE3 bacterium]